VITREIGKIVRGKATPHQVASAAVLGAILAFLPAFDQAAGLYVLVVGTLLVLNANLGVALLVALPSKLVAVAAAPLSFAIGRMLLDGPLSWLFGWLINAPLTAYFGLEYYVTTGGLVLGAAFGGALGWMLVTMLQFLRSTFAELERDTEEFWEFTDKRWVKLTSFLFLGGGRGKRTYDDLLHNKVGLPVRPAGLVLLGVALALTLVFQSSLSSSFLANSLQRSLERTNGATVDVSGLDLDLGRGRLTLAGLALADPDAPDRDAFRATGFVADVSTTDLLRKRFTIDRIVIADATSGEARATRGERTRGGPPGVVRSPEAPTEEALSIADVFEDPLTWQARLTAMQRWIERLAPATAPEAEGLRERLERRAQEVGHSELRASHLIQGRPRFLISELVIDALHIAALEDETFELHARNLTTQPHLVEGVSSVELSARSGRLEAFLAGDRVRLAVQSLSVDHVAGSLLVGGVRPVVGGTLDLILDAPWSAGRTGHLSTSITVKLHDSLLTLPGLPSAVVNRFELPIQLSGPLGDLALGVDDEALVAALIDAGQEALAERVRARALEPQTETPDDLIGQVLPERR